MEGAPFYEVGMEVPHKNKRTSVTESKPDNGKLHPSKIESKHVETCKAGKAVPFCFQ